MKRYFEVKFNDGELFRRVNTLEEAKEIRNNNNWRYISRSLHIYEETFDGERWSNHKIV